MNWIEIGFCAKRRVIKSELTSGRWPIYEYPNFPCLESVEEICSVSNCISQRYGESNDAERDGQWGLFAQAARARATVTSEHQAASALYAYRLWPVQFENGEEEEIEFWFEPEIETLPKSFVRLGWDALVGGNGHGLGCSPLSCNAGCDIVRCPQLNRYCLVNDADSAMALARSFSITQPEPGPYCVVEVWGAPLEANHPQKE